MAKSIIGKAFEPKPSHEEVDWNARGIWVVCHKVSGKTVKAWGWSLKEILHALNWKDREVWAIQKCPYKKHRAAIDLSPRLKPDLDLSELNKQERRY